MAGMIKLLVKRIKNTRVGNPMIRQLPLYLSLLLSGLFLLTLDGRAGEAGEKFTSGIYEGLMLAVNDEGELQGFFKQSLGAVDVTCSFFLKGKDSGGQANIISWSGQRFREKRKNPKIYSFPGLLKNASVNGTDAIDLKIEQGFGHPGCGVDVAEGMLLSRTAKANWVSLRMVKNTRAPLFSGPALDKKTKSYVIRNDVLGVVSMNGEWINVEFPREGKKPIKGWVRTEDVEELMPPQK